MGLVSTIWRYRGSSPTGNTSFPQPVLEAAGGSPLLARLLANRGLTEPDAIRAFLELDKYQPTDARQLPDVDIAVKRIVKAIEQREPILIYGDFDVDGITGTSVLYETLKTRLNANVSYYIPDRATEGHGLNSAAMVRLTSTRKLKLVVTTDTGITNFSEISLLNGLGVDTIVTDHHALPENLPPALANVNPQRLLIDNPEHPLGPMCGAGVAYKLCELLLAQLLPEAEAAAAAEALLDIVAVGTVVDMVPLIRENRYLVYKGLQVLNRRERQGFQELLSQAGASETATINSETLGFSIGPRLNALGRLERAEQGVELLTSSDTERIRIIAAHLEFLNRKRRELCDQTFLEADAHLQRQGGLGDNRTIILASPDWNPGIIGIVASRLIEKYNVPVFMMVVDESKAIARCSARSIPDFHVHDQLLALEDYFLNFGGHGGAAGFAVKLDRLENFKRELYAICAKFITDEQMKPVVMVDARLDWGQLNPNLIEIVDRIAPFGMDNPSPRFVIEPVQIAAQRRIGEGERHLKLVLAPSGKTRGALPLDALMWNVGSSFKLEAGEDYGFVVNPSLNTFNGVTKLQVVVEDHHLTNEAKQTVIEAQKNSSSLNAAKPATASSMSVQTAASITETPESPSTGTRWIDHRSRDNLDAFVAQLMLPVKDGRKILIYHEGRPPEIPFLDQRLLASRSAGRPADELILWDLPPSPDALKQLLSDVAPEVIHLVGGKARTIPIFQPEKNYLTLILQFLRREAPEPGQAFSLLSQQTAERLATSEDALNLGLILLERLGMLTVQIESNATEAASLSLSVQLLAGNKTLDMTRQLEFQLFKKALQEVAGFRGWLLKSPLDTIKSVLNSPLIGSFDLASAPQVSERMTTPAESGHNVDVPKKSELAIPINA